MLLILNFSRTNMTLQSAKMIYQACYSDLYQIIGKYR